jgi:hypothetical protein
MKKVERGAWSVEHGRLPKPNECVGSFLIVARVETLHALTL